MKRSLPIIDQRAMVRRGNGCPAAPSSAFDFLCDHLLLKILSYNDDLRSLIRLTRCTSKSLRNRFDPQKETTNENSGHCSQIWQGVFADLLLTPLGMDESKTPFDYLSAIGYRMSLFHRLIAHDKRSKVDSNAACFSLALRHHFFKPLPGSERLWLDDDNSTGSILAEPFALMSGGTGKDFVIINPQSFSIEIHHDILEDAICLDETVQKKILDGPNYAGHEDLEESLIAPLSSSNSVPNQVLMGTYFYSLRNSEWDCRFVDDDWAEYFGEGTPFSSGRARADSDPSIFSPEILSAGVTITTFDKTVVVKRSLTDQDNLVCTELAVWDKNGHGEETNSEFVIRNIVRVPGSLDFFTFSSDGDRIFACFDNCSLIPGGPYPGAEDTRRAVFHFDLAPSSLSAQSAYPQPKGFFIARNEVISLSTFGRDHLLVGTKVGTIEIWDCHRLPYCHIKSFFAGRSFPPEQGFPPNAIVGIQSICNVSPQYGFVTMQQSNKYGTIIILWQTPTINFNQDFDVQGAGFKIMAKIKYECYSKIVCNGRSIMVLAYDKLGCLYLDIYHIIGSRYISHEPSNVDLPEDVKAVNLHPHGKNRIQFANRINLQHYIELTYHEGKLDMPEWIFMAVNSRYIVVSATEGLNESDGTRKAAPGLIVVDLDENTTE